MIKLLKHILFFIHINYFHMFISFILIFIAGGKNKGTQMKTGRVLQYAES